MKNITSHLNTIFKSRRQAAISLREHFNCTETAKLMGISRRAVWMHCTNRAKKTFEDKHLTKAEVQKITKVAR